MSFPFAAELDETQRAFVTKQPHYVPDDQLDEDVNRLAEWVSKQPHLPDGLDKKWLLHFIIGCKCNLHKAKQTIDAYFVTRAEHPEFFSPLDPEYVKENMKNGAVILFPKRTPEAYRVLCTKLNPMSNDVKLDFLLYFQSNLLALDLQMREEPIRGEILLFDLKYYQLSQFLSLSPTMTKNFINLCINTFPLSVKGIHFINSPPFIGQLMVLVKMFLTDKLKEKIYVHDTLESLYQYIPKDVLPDIYGGTGGNYEKMTDDWFQYGVSNNEWLGNRPKADLSKRIDKPKNDNSCVDGTFRQLQID